jgi:hypothetical protein
MSQLVLEKRYGDIYYIKTYNQDLYEWQLLRKEWGSRNPIVNIPMLYNPQANQYKAACTLPIKYVLRFLKDNYLDTIEIVQDLINLGWEKQVKKYFAEEN